MIKRLKTIAIVFIVLGILCSFGGLGFAKLEEANRGTKISSGYMKDGEFVSTGGGYIGANKEGEETAAALKVVFYALGVIMVASGVVCFAVAVKKDNAELIRQQGKVLEKENVPNAGYSRVTVEFDDNSRKTLIVEPNVIVALGDVGSFGYKKDLLVEFSKK